MKEEINGVRTELKEETNGVKVEINGVKAELKKEINGVKVAINSVTDRLIGVEDEFGRVRADMKRGFETAHRELYKTQQALELVAQDERHKLKSALSLEISEFRHYVRDAIEDAARQQRETAQQSAEYRAHAHAELDRRIRANKDAIAELKRGEGAAGV